MVLDFECYMHVGMKINVRNEQVCIAAQACTHYKIALWYFMRANLPLLLLSISETKSSGAIANRRQLFWSDFDCRAR
jgi:hypothetical protein